MVTWTGPTLTCLSAIARVARGAIATREDFNGGCLQLQVDPSLLSMTNSFVEPNAVTLNGLQLGGYVRQNTQNQFSRLMKLPDAPVQISHLLELSDTISEGSKTPPQACCLEIDNAVKYLKWGVGEVSQERATC